MPIDAAVEGCWASELGGCGGKRSREHIVSGGMWPGPTVSVQGFPWCRDTPKVVGVGALTTKNLCRAHNTALSRVDDAAIDAFRSYRRAARLVGERSAQPHTPWRTKSFAVRGDLLERWFLKTAVNVAHAYKSDRSWALDGSPLGDPSVSIQRYAFGHEKIPSPMGLYCAVRLGGEITAVNGLSGAPVFGHKGDDAQCLGFAFTFAGWRYLLWMLPTEPPAEVQMIDSHEEEWRSNELLHRMTNLNFVVAGRPSHRIAHAWGGLTRIGRLPGGTTVNVPLSLDR